MPRHLRLPAVTVDKDAPFHSVSFYLDGDSPAMSACLVCGGIPRLYWREVETDALVAECLVCGATDYQPALLNLI